MMGRCIVAGFLLRFCGFSLLLVPLLLRSLAGYTWQKSAKEIFFGVNVNSLWHPPPLLALFTLYPQFLVLVVTGVTFVCLLLLLFRLLIGTRLGLLEILGGVDNVLQVREALGLAERHPAAGEPCKEPWLVHSFGNNILLLPVDLLLHNHTLATRAPIRSRGFLRALVLIVKNLLERQWFHIVLCHILHLVIRPNHDMPHGLPTELEPEAHLRTRRAFLV
mmetsp:Transcript_45649/g.71525  ORF Transcript_45649/g.71525 Transcript_45649/m.71525 type:complete len:220 (+) Transcript_45649:1608-2267(+)